MGEPECGRKLGLLESMYVYLTNRFNTSIYFQTGTLKSNCLFTVDEFKESLKVLINFQPFLRMKVVHEESATASQHGGGKGGYFFRPCDEVDISSLLRVCQKSIDNDWMKIIKQEEDFLSREERFGDGPLWRVVLSMPEVGQESTASSSEEQPCYEYDVVFIMNHMFVEAVSSYDMFYRQLLPILNSVINKIAIDDKFLHPLPLAPCYEEEFLKMSDSTEKTAPWYIRLLFNALRAKTRLFGKNIYDPLIKANVPPCEDSAGPYGKVIKKELLEKMLKKRKEKDVGVHSIIITAMSFAIMKLLLKYEIPLPNAIVSGWPKDSRKYNAKFKSPQPLGMFTAKSGLSNVKVPKHASIDYDVFWEKAKDISDTMKKGLREDNDFLGPKALMYIVEQLKNEDNVGKMFGELGFKPYFTFSNLSKCSPGPDLEETTPKFVDVNEMYFGLCGKGFQEYPFAFFITATNHKDQIFLACMYNWKYIGRDGAKDFMDYTEEMLVMACEENPTKDFYDFEHIELTN
eukprot:gene20066-22035_t